MLIEELNRNRLLYSGTTDPPERRKYKAILSEIVLPQIDEMLCEIKENYGEALFKDYETLIKENT